MGRKMTLHKLVILGDGGVGKTAMVRQVSLEQFIETYDPTIEDSYMKRVVIDNQPCLLDILDTAGQEEYTALREQWIRDGEGFVLVYSINSRSSFIRIKKFHQQILRVKESAHSVPAYPNSHPIKPPNAAEVPIVLVGNKADRVTEREVATKEGVQLAHELGVQFMEASAKDCYNVEKAFYDVVRLLRHQQQHEKAQSPDARPLSGEAAYQIIRTFWGSRRIIIPPLETSTESGRSRLTAAFISATKSNDERLVLAYLEAGVDVNTHSGTDGSALHAAAATGHANIVNILLKKGAAVNARGPTGAPPLQLAAAEGHLAIVRLLVHKGAMVNQTGSLHGTALSAAASRGRADVVRFLLKNGANVGLAGGPYGNSLQAASWNGNPLVIRHLLNAGADIRARGDGDCTALQIAAFVGNSNAIQVLLERGAKVDIDAPGGKYGSALKAATEGNHYRAVNLLLEAGATPLQLPTYDMGDDEKESRKSDDGYSKEGESAIQGESATSIASPDATTPSVVFLPNFSPVSNELSRLSGYSTTSSSPAISSPTDSTPPSSPLANRRFSLLRNAFNNSSLNDRPVINPLGFSTIHDSPKAAVDIVFIHGLQGHPEKTWTYVRNPPKRKISLRQKLYRSLSASVVEKPSSVYWPRDLLAQNEDFADTRIMTWGYDTFVVKEFFGAGDQQNISQHGHNFMVHLQQERKSNPHRPLIFIAHSLGGIVLKVALDNSKRSTHQPQYLSIYTSTKGIIFLGTPHGGSIGADWGLLVSRIVKCALQSPSERILRGLVPNSELLENLRRAFLQMLEDGHFNIHSFYETGPILAYGLSSLVVPYESSLVGHARKEIAVGLPGNHSKICKFSGPDDPAYRSVLGALQDYVQDAVLSSG